MNNATATVSSNTNNDSAIKVAPKGSAKEALWKALEDMPVIPFNAQWANGTGYLDDAVSSVYAPEVAVGTVVQSTDNHGRRIGIVGTAIGNIVVFDRYSDVSTSVVVCNAPKALLHIMGINDGALSVADVKAIFGDGTWTYNAGINLEAIARAIKVHAAKGMKG